MVSIPANVLELLAKPETVKALITASDKGVPHAIVAGSIMSPAPDTMVYGEILSKTTAKNLSMNKKVEFLIVSGKESYGIHCTVKARLDHGPEVDAMNAKLAAIKLKAAAMWVFTVDSVYDQSASPKAGTKLA